MKLVIDRSRWLRGAEAAEQGSSLQNTVRGKTSDGKRCCLGFLTLACGFTEEEITGKSYPSRVLDNFADITDFPEQLRPLVQVTAIGFSNTDLARTLAATNDSIKIHDTEREKYIIEDFSASLGVEVTFVDSVEPPTKEQWLSYGEHIMAFPEGCPVPECTWCMD